MASHYAIQSLDEAKAYLRHPLLGSRLRECIGILHGFQDRSIEDVLGPLDALKFRSCITLFLQADEDGQLFRRCLQQFFANRPDTLTIRRLESMISIAAPE